MAERANGVIEHVPRSFAGERAGGVRDHGLGVARRLRLHALLRRARPAPPPPPDLRHPFRAATWVGGLSPEAELLDLHWRPIKSLKAGAGNSARVHILCRKNCSGFRRRPSSRGPPAHRSTGPGPSARFVCFRHGDRRGTLPPTRATPVWHGGQPEARTAVAL